MNNPAARSGYAPVRTGCCLPARAIRHDVIKMTTDMPKRYPISSLNVTS